MQIELQDNLSRDVEKLIKATDLGETFSSWAAYKYVGRYRRRLFGIIVYSLQICQEEYVPRFIHIILHPDFRRNRKVLEFLRETEHDLRKKGFGWISAYIKPERRHMAVLAQKFGYEEYAEDKEGKYYYKNL